MERSYGFHCDALCQDGYILTLYFQNKPAPKKINLDLSPLHYRVRSLFYCIQHKFHQCGMDNLYMSLYVYFFISRIRSKTFWRVLLTRDIRYSLNVCFSKKKIPGIKTEVYCHKKFSSPLWIKSVLKHVALLVYDQKMVHYFCHHVQKSSGFQVKDSLLKVT